MKNYNFLNEFKISPSGAIVGAAGGAIAGLGSKLIRNAILRHKLSKEYDKYIEDHADDHPDEEIQAHIEAKIRKLYGVTSDIKTNIATLLKQKEMLSREKLLMIQKEDMMAANKLQTKLTLINHELSKLRKALVAIRNSIANYETAVKLKNFDSIRKDWVKRDASKQKHEKYKKNKKKFDPIFGAMTGAALGSIFGRK